jgi:hypothetical protein
LERNLSGRSLEGVFFHKDGTPDIRGARVASTTLRERETALKLAAQRAGQGSREAQEYADFQESRFAFGQLLNSIEHARKTAIEGTALQRLGTADDVLNDAERRLRDGTVDAGLLDGLQAEIGRLDGERTRWDRLARSQKYEKPPGGDALSGSYASFNQSFTDINRAFAERLERARELKNKVARQAKEQRDQRLRQAEADRLARGTGPRTRAQLGMERSAQREIERLGTRIRQLRRARDSVDDTRERAYQDERIAELEREKASRTEALVKAREEADYAGLAGRERDQLKSRAFFEVATARVKGHARDAGYRVLDFGRMVNKRARATVASGPFEDFGDQLRESARVTGFGWLSRATARRYQRQQDAAREAQRTASSSLWRWWYKVTRPVKVLISIAFASWVMAPVGIMQYGGWMFFAMGSFVGNALYKGFVEAINIVVFAVLSAYNIAGFAVQQGATALGEFLVCNWAAKWVAGGCAYHPLAFTWAVRTFTAPPLIDARLYYPTLFNNNSMVSSLFDLIQGTPSVVILASTIAIAFLVSVFVLANKNRLTRWVAFCAIIALSFPALGAQAWGTSADVFTCTSITRGQDGQPEMDAPHACGFYAFIASQLRTGTGNLFIGPAQALAKQVEDGFTSTDNAAVVPGRS